MEKPSDIKTILEWFRSFYDERVAGDDMSAKTDELKAMLVELVDSAPSEITKCKDMKYCWICHCSDVDKWKKEQKEKL